MKKISIENRRILNEANIFGLDLNLFVQKYKLTFVLRLYRYLKKETSKSKSELIYPRFPENYLESYCGNYVEDLENCGFKLKKWKEDFIDEDDGNIVAIQRFRFKPLRKKKTINKPSL